MARYIRCPGVPELGIKCGKQFGSLSEIEFDHIKSNEVDPDNSPENCSPKCKECHLAKTIKKDALAAKKGRHIRKETKKSRRPKIKIRNGQSFATNRNGPLKMKMDGTVEKRK